MFAYTRAASRKIMGDIERLAFALSTISQLFSVGYLLYILLFGEGIFAIRVGLLALSALYLLFFLVATAYSVKRKLKKQVKFAYVWSRRLVKLFNLGVIIYGFASSAHTSFSLLLVAFFIVSWALDLVIGILSFVLSAWLRLFFIGVETDLEEFKETVAAPFTATGNFFKRMTGKEIVERQAYQKSEQQLLLDSMVEAEKTQREKERQRILQKRREDKLDAKAQKKADKKAAKAVKKELRRIHTPSVITEEEEV